MFSLKQAIVLALAGSAIAKPISHWGGYNRDSNDSPIGGRISGTQGYSGSDKYVVVYDGSSAVIDTTVTVTVTAGSAPTPAAPVITTTAAAAITTAAPVTTGSSDQGYMAVVNKWRATMGKAALTQSSQLEANALKTCTDHKGQMVHELNSGSMGQVLAPGNADNFEKVFVGGWLCERPSLPGLSAVCPAMVQGWDHSNGETGHADILSSTSYTKIGCALAYGLWACDVA